MNAYRLLQKLQALEVQLIAKGDLLHVDAPRGVLSPDLRAALAEQKTDLLKLLRPDLVPCWNCGSTRFWLQPACQLWRCAVCHPPLPGISAKDFRLDPEEKK